MRFEFATATRILFGPGTLPEVGPAIASLGQRALVVTGATPERAQALLDLLAQHQVASVTFSVAGEPTLATVQEGTLRARAEQCDVVVGFGGGSVLDVAKAVAALLTNGGEPLDYLEGIGRGRPLTRPAAPCVAIPTTAGTGAEVTRNAVLTSPEHRVKVSMRSPLMLPRLSLVDPNLTHSLPPRLTAITGLDALTQLIEPFVSARANPLVDGICREGLVRVRRSLLRAYEKGDDAAAREDMALASLFSGLALANAGLGAVHGFAGVLGGRISAPHGAICARLLPLVMEVNLRALRQRDKGHPALERYKEIGALLAGKPSGAEAVAWVNGLVERLAIPPLGTYGLRSEAIPLIVERASAASSMKANPIALTREEMEEILQRAL